MFHIHQQEFDKHFKQYISHMIYQCKSNLRTDILLHNLFLLNVIKKHKNVFNTVMAYGDTELPGPTN